MFLVPYLKIVLIIISAALLSAGALYPSHASSDALRLPLGREDDTLKRVEDLSNLAISREIIDLILSEEKTKDFYLSGINYGIGIEKYRLTGKEFALFMAKVMTPFIVERSRAYNRDLSQYFYLLKAGRDSADPTDASWKEYQYFTRLTLAASRVLSVTEGMTALFRFHGRWNLEKYLDSLVSEKHRRGDYSISIKSIGCSRGDQPYSIAFILHKKLEEYHKKIGSPQPAQWDIEIEAFDMNIPSLYATNLGIYRSSFAKGEMQKFMTEEDFYKYFERIEGSKDLYRVMGFIREWIKPKYIDILDNNHLGILGSNRSEIIFFTNVLIHNLEGFSTPLELEKVISDSFRHDYDHLFVSGNDSTVSGVILAANESQPDKSKVVREPWYRQKIDASKIFDEEFIKGNHAAIIKMADNIETATSGAVEAYNVKDFDIEEYLRACKVLERICMMEVSGPEELERLMFELQFFSDESSNRMKDQWGYFNNSAIPKIRILLKEMFEDSKQEIIDKDPLAFAVKLFVDFIREQPFHEANHRTADFLMNLILVKHGLPVFFLTSDNVIEYHQLTNTSNLQDENFNEADLKRIQAFFHREIENSARRAALPVQAAGFLSTYVSATSRALLSSI